MSKGDVAVSVKEERSAYDQSKKLSYTTKYETDCLGKVLKETNIENGSIQYAYDLLGRLTSQTDAKGVTRTFTYDNKNRLVSESLPFANGKNSVRRYEYDGNGNRTAESITNSLPTSCLLYTSRCV